MTIAQRLLTPGQPFYWAMIILPNFAILAFSLWKSAKYKPLVLIGLAALLNICMPLAQMIIFNRCNGINAPGTPEWIVWTVGGIFTNQGTIVLLLALAALFLIVKDFKGKE